MSADLKINISGDASSAIAALKNTSVAADAAAPAVLRVGQAFDKASFDAAAMAAQMSNYVDRTRAVAPAAAEATAAIQAEVVAQTELNAATQAANGGFGSFIDTQAKAKIAFIDVGRAVTGQGFSLRSLASNFSLLGPEVVIGVAAIYLLVEGLIKLSEQETFAAKQQNLLNVAIGQAQASTAGEVAEVNSLVAIAGDETKSRQERAQALGKLNDEYSDYFPNANLDEITSGKLKASTDALTSSLLLNAKAKAIQGEIEKSASRLSSAQNDDNAKLLSFYDKAKIGLAGVFGGYATGQLQGVSQATAAYGDVVKNETDLQNKLAKQLQDTNTELAKQGSLFKPKPVTEKDTTAADDKAYAKAEADQLEFIRNSEKLSRTARENEISDQNAKFERIKAELVKNDIETQTITEANRQKILDINAKYDDINAENDKRYAAEDVDAQIKAYQEEQRAAEQASRARIEQEKQIQAALQVAVEERVSKGIITQKEGDREILKANVENLTQLLNSGVLSSKDKIVVSIELDKAKADQFKKGLTDAELATVAFKTKVAGILQNLAVDGIAQIGVAIGDLFTGGGIKSAVNGFLSLLGDALISIGKAAISTAIQIEAIKKAINTLIASGPLGGAIAVGLGIAAIALGTALKNKVSNVKAFAEGGIVTGPTNALIGEAGTEVVFPLAKLNRFIKGISNGSGNTNVNLDGNFRLQGSDLYLAVQSESQKRTRFR